MCGGVLFPYRREYHDALEEFYTPEQVADFEKSGQVRSLYWQKSEPVLPVVMPAAEDAGAFILRWGNRDKEAPFPQTGWARIESIEEGKWAYLKPVPVVIPVTFGVEKGKWFSIKQGIKGVVVQRAGQQRIYMLTDDANPEFLARTGHARMPVLVDQTDFPWLNGDPAGTNNAQQSPLKH